MRIYRANSYEELSRKAANIISAQVIIKPNSVLGLATGSSPIGTYKQLIEWYKKGDLDFAEVKSVNLDEYRGLGKESDQSYVYFMHHNFFDHINIKPENINIPDGKNPDAAAECARYDKVIEDLGGIDIQLLGIGRNGHIGFNEPGAAFEKDTHCVDLTESTIEANKRFFASADDVPRQAYTMGIRSIMHAKQVLLIASGKDKAEAIYKSFWGPVTPEVPASVLQLHQNVVLVADNDALSLAPCCAK
ncbi:MAG: glucosamine-6-phosphate deaminase [Anaerobiospirillum sp.]|nr:glucosamine-6-phosphate deaminase [Anaerobiospirillum sp.]